MIRIESDWSEIDKELDRIIGMPDAKTQALLGAVLSEGFGITQAQVHVQTGSLKGSGKEETSTDKLDHTWEGTIEYGGPSTGPNNPVDYAIYEQRREPDEHYGNHDFMAGLGVLHEQWIAAVKKGLAG